ncbi:hypothetical protein BJX70DRAFT_191217 [Aspergillus crustosus]
MNIIPLLPLFCLTESIVWEYQEYHDMYRYGRACGYMYPIFGTDPTESRAIFVPDSPSHLLQVHDTTVQKPIKYRNLTMADPIGPLIRYADVAVTFTADQFQGIYRGKKYHESDIQQVLQRAKEYGCEKVMLTTMSLPLAHENLKLVRQFPDMCTMTLGVHPYHAGEIYASSLLSAASSDADQSSSSNSDDSNGSISNGERYVAELRALAVTLLSENTPHGPPLVAFGEIGLDYDYLVRCDKETQIRAFTDQLHLACSLSTPLPLFLHIRNSFSDFVSIITPFLPRIPRRGLVHSFAGSKAEMETLVSLGFDISVNGISFRTEESLEMVRALPLERLQFETDAPWCEVSEGDEKIKAFLSGETPVPGSRKHGKFREGDMVKGRNESCLIERVARVVAGLKGLSLEEVAGPAWANSVKMFGLGIVDCE